MLGGFVGGACSSSSIYSPRQPAPPTYFWSALGLVILGACIGSLSALVQAVFQPASVKVLRGWQEGREYPLDKAASLLGRDEHADIALFRDMKVEKKHGYIKQISGKYFLVNNGAPPEFTLVNEQPVADQCRAERRRPHPARQRDPEVPDAGRGNREKKQPAARRDVD